MQECYFQKLFFPPPHAQISLCWLKLCSVIKIFQIYILERRFFRLPLVPIATVFYYETKLPILCIFLINWK